MTASLFVHSRQLERLPIPDAQVYLRPQLLTLAQCSVLLESLLTETAWRTETITLFGKTHLQPRLIAWHGDREAQYTYSGLRLTPAPWSPTLLAIKTAVEHACDEAFNSVLLNYYRNERDSMGLHSDDEPELGTAPVIASVSLGDSRVFTMKHKRDRAVPPVRLSLASGSLLLMCGDTQRNWRHGVPKSQRPCAARVNLTFRMVRPRAGSD